MSIFGQICSLAWWQSWIKDTKKRQRGKTRIYPNLPICIHSFVHQTFWQIKQSQPIRELFLVQLLLLFFFSCVCLGTTAQRKYWPSGKCTGTLLEVRARMYDGFSALLMVRRSTAKHNHTPRASVDVRSDALSMAACACAQACESMFNLNTWAPSYYFSEAWGLEAKRGRQASTVVPPHPINRIYVSFWHIMRFWIETSYVGFASHTLN